MGRSRGKKLEDRIRQTGKKESGHKLRRNTQKTKKETQISTKKKKKKKAYVRRCSSDQERTFGKKGAYRARSKAKKRATENEKKGIEHAKIRLKKR